MKQYWFYVFVTIEGLTRANPPLLGKVISTQAGRGVLMKSDMMKQLPPCCSSPDPQHVTAAQWLAGSLPSKN